ncbi:hypothetical protein HA402_005285 [Bradysia odoriphaga]|nr:hypothetical protein HA402_005285 [Bradysia odoriphaga]
MVLESFYDNASVCTGLEINLPENREARGELTSLCKFMAKDGMSLVARDVQLDKIIGVAFNKIQIKGDPDEPSEYFMFRKQNKNTNSDNGKVLLKVMTEIDQALIATNTLTQIAYLIYHSFAQFQDMRENRLEKC